MAFLEVLAIVFVSFLAGRYHHFLFSESYNSTQLYKAISIGGGIEYPITLVTDLDHDTKNGKKWQSLVSKGKLTVAGEKVIVSLNPKDEFYIDTNIAAGGRAMELSDLVVFNGGLYSIDDRTGLIYKIENNKAIPWVLVNDGPGNVVKGLKGEWMTVKNGEVIVGGLGKEWTTTEGVYVNDHPMWVKYVSPNGAVRHVNWKENFIAVRKAVGIVYPGYMIHEAVQWSEHHKKWFFLPRRLSNETYSEADDETRGSNAMIIADESFSNFQVVRIGDVERSARGFSAFQFVPNTNDNLVVALKSEEKDGKPVASYILIFNITGKILLPETPLHGSFKYEGIAFA